MVLCVSEYYVRVLRYLALYLSFLQELELTSKLCCTSMKLFFITNCRDLGWQQRYTRFCGRIVVLSVLVLLLYPFLWVWTVIGTLWFSSARGCVSTKSWMEILISPFMGNYSLHNSLHLQLPEEGQKWGFLIWLLFSYCGLSCIACVAVGKVLLNNLS